MSSGGWPLTHTSSSNTPDITVEQGLLPPHCRLGNRGSQGLWPPHAGAFCGILPPHLHMPFQAALHTSQSHRSGAVGSVLSTISKQGYPPPQHCPSPAWMSHLPYLLRLKIGPQGAISDSATSLVVVFAHCSNHGHPPSTAPSGWSSPSCLHCSDTLPFPGCLLIIKTLGAGNTQPPPLSPLPPTLRS